MEWYFLLKSHLERPPYTHIFTDALGNWGCGAYGKSGWFKAPWSAEWLAVNITAKDMVSVVPAIVLCGEALKTLHVQFHSDNMAVVEMIKARTSRDSKVMHLLRCLHFFTAKHDIYITAVHVLGVDNIRADALSRNNAD